MNNFNDKRYDQEKFKTISRGRPYFEGSSEKEFKDDLLKYAILLVRKCDKEMA
jgi:hypothetical protein